MDLGSTITFSIINLQLWICYIVRGVVSNVKNVGVTVRVVSTNFVSYFKFDLALICMKQT